MSHSLSVREKLTKAEWENSQNRCPNWPKDIPHHRTSHSVHQLWELPGRGTDRSSGTGSAISWQWCDCIVHHLWFFTLFLLLLLSSSTIITVFYLVSIIKLFLTYKFYFWLLPIPPGWSQQLCGAQFPAKSQHYECHQNMFKNQNYAVRVIFFVNSHL